MSKSIFPAGIDVFDRFIDPDLASLAAIRQYKIYISQDNLTAAKKVLDENPRLKNMIANASNLNQMIDAITALELFFLNVVQSYIIELVKHKGTWNSSVKYTKYETVDYMIDGGINTYMGVVQEIPIGTLPTNANYFIAITLRGAQGVSGTGMSPRGVWANGVQYYQYDCVVLDNILWYAKSDNISSQPQTLSLVWGKLMQLSKQTITSSDQPSAFEQEPEDFWNQVISDGKVREKIKNADGSYSTIHKETLAELVKLSTGKSVEEVLSTKFATTQTFTATIGLSWGTLVPYVQTINVEGVLATDNPSIDVLLTGVANTDNPILEAWGMVSRITTKSGGITVTCYDDKPSVQIPIQIKVVR